MKNSDKDTCGDYGGTSKQSGEPCARVAGWGTEFEDGKCSYHRGTNSDGSSHEGNTNSVSHGAYADQSNLYNDVFSDAERQIADDIFEDYVERYKDLHGDIPTGHELRLFKLSVNAVTEIRVENWVNQKPDSLESGTTFIDRNTERKRKEGEDWTEVTYKKSPALAAKKTLSNENRKWLKDLGLLEDPQSQAADSVQNLAEVWEADLTD